MNATKSIKSWRVSWTADHEQYYPGHTTAFSEYTHCGRGCGETIREAFEDAVENLHEQLPDMTEALAEIVDGLTAELVGQVKAPEMLDWDIVQAECPESGEHYKDCPTCDGNGRLDGDGISDKCEECDADFQVEDEDPDCAVCAGEWHFYVNVDVQVEDEPTYQVLVGNIGTVYTGINLEDATKTYAEYVGQSRLGYGRASGESVTLMADGEIRQEHVGTVEENNG